MSKSAFVIMLNGSARLVVIGTEEQAREKMEGLAREDFAERVAPFKSYQTFTQYREAVRWRIWDVELLDLRPTVVGVDMASGPDYPSTVVMIRTDNPVNEGTTRKLLADLKASGHTVYTTGGQ